MEENEIVEDGPLFPEVPEDLSSLGTDQIVTLIDELSESIDAVTANPSEFITADLGGEQLLELTKAAVETRRALRAELTGRDDDTTPPAAEAAAEISDETAAAFAELAEEDEPPAGDEGGDEPPADEAAAAAPEVTAAAPPAPVMRRRLPKPSPSRQVAEHQPAERTPQVSLVAAAGAPDMAPGDHFGSELEIAEAMIARHRNFGMTGPGAVEKFGIAKADWGDLYGERTLGLDHEANFELIKQVVRPDAIRAELARRIRHQLDNEADLDSLEASGGLCAPVTPYYSLQYISVPNRPVMAALPSFNADRGGLRYARPAALSAVTSAVGIITADEDEAGGSAATKSCQVIPCPPFQETDVDIIYHCLQFGNLGARTFPELVAQWNNLVLAAHARLAESNLLTQIDGFSTQVTAGSLGLGASATLFSQILVAADGLRSRNRMNPDAVLRLLLPFWAVDLIISDVIRTQFQRFETDKARVIALLRSFNIEPSFYIDGANGRGQVFGTQADGPLDAFPPDVVWYLYPEGSFLYLDGGTLELGIVRDSVLNKTNDFQIFGETFENVAFVGVEALAVVSEVCDSGAVSAPAEAPECPIDYTP